MTDVAAPGGLRTTDFDFFLPDHAIAQTPAVPRDTARMLCVGDGVADRQVRDLPGLLRRGDILVVNDTRVIPAQLTARRGEARIGVTLDRPLPDGSWFALLRNTRRVRENDVLVFEGAEDFSAMIIALPGDGVAHLRFSCAGDIFGAKLRAAGKLALPPYIDRPEGPSAQDEQDYQTAFARIEGAVAAPTAGLHFTKDLLRQLEDIGVQRATVTLHVGAGTFLPVRVDDLAGHKMHAERGEISATAADKINAARRAGGRVIVVGTTSLRLLESSCDDNGFIKPFKGETAIFIHPGIKVRSADLLMTNFHLPRSTLFMLVCAFAGEARMKAAYAHAIESGYRFFSYGDATLLERA
jgi:S-adenosylmethionine:tRNA ribosyltransferase-isomerase